MVCSSGTYIRAIARDVGRELGSKAHLASLRRTEIGPWKVEDASETRVRPMAEALAHLPAVILPAEAARRFAQGQKIPVSAGDDGPTAVFDVGDLVGVGLVRDGLLLPDVVLSG